MLDWAMVIFSARMLAPVSLVLFACLLAGAPRTALGQEFVPLSPEKTTETGGESSTFAVVKASRANVRLGPSFDHAVKWVYRRSGVPVAVIERFEHWRRIRDMDGDEGWVHFALLDSTARGGIVRRGGGDAADAPLPLLADAAGDAATVALLEPGVVLEVLSCAEAWCRVVVGERQGWVLRKGLWGVGSRDF